MNSEALVDENNAVRLENLTLASEPRTSTEKRQESVCWGSTERERIDPIVLSFTPQGDNEAPPQLCSYICGNDPETGPTLVKDEDEV